MNLIEVDPREEFEITSDKQMVTVADGLDIPVITAFRLLAARLKSIGKYNAILLKDKLVLLEMGCEPIEIGLPNKSF